MVVVTAVVVVVEVGGDRGGESGGGDGSGGRGGGDGDGSSPTHFTLPHTCRGVSSGCPPPVPQYPAPSARQGSEGTIYALSMHAHTHYCLTTIFLHISL